MDATSRCQGHTAGALLHEARAGHELKHFVKLKMGKTIGRVSEISKESRKTLLQAIEDLRNAIMETMCPVGSIYPGGVFP